MPYIIYGKRTETIYNKISGNSGGPDKKFAALDRYGVRVSRLADAALYDTKEEAQEKINKSGLTSGVVFEIRKAKNA